MDAGRFELKYPVEPLRATRFLEELSPLLEPDGHGRDGAYTIYSLYYDTRDLSCLREKIEGVPNRIKFRLRSYPGDGSGAAYLESKTRFRHYVRKERQRVTAEQAAELSRGPLTPRALARIVPSSHPLAGQVASRLSRGLLLPVVGVLYRRRALILRGSRNLRVTMDHSLQALAPDAPPAFPRRGLAPDPWVLEIKGHGLLPVEIQDALARHDLVARSFSKYGECIARRPAFPLRASHF